MKKLMLVTLLITANAVAQIQPAPSIGPVLETPSMNGIVIKPAPGIINLNNIVVPTPVAKPSCSLFDIWGNNSGVCNKFPSHVEAEQHYEACSARVKELDSQLDNCKNDLAECKNDLTLPPVPSASPMPSSPSGSVVPGCAVIANASESRFIYKQSAPLRGSAPGSPIIGFRREPTLIMNTNISSRGTIPILDGKGATIATCPWATADGHAGGRARCTAQSASVRQAAIKNTNSPTIYFKLNPELCVRVLDAGRCENSSKGLCDTLIQ